MLQQTLKNKKLPPLRKTEEMMEILCREEYGTPVPKPDGVRFEVKGKPVPFCAGEASLWTVTAHCKLGEKEFSFPFRALLPTKAEKRPFFVHVNFHPEVPERYLPAEEIWDHGFAVLALCYEDVTTDDGDFQNGLAGVLYPDGKRGPTDPGKIAMWAWGASRLLDYAHTVTELLDTERAVVCGHSRLGKTALLAGALDPRFAAVYSNDSGCSGAAITRDKEGETVDQICNRFPYWFCENYQKYRNNEGEMPFDQHYLIASIAPRPVCVGSATMDAWADPASEQLSCVAASEAYEALCKKGYVAPRDRFAAVGEAFFEGTIGYHLRRGTHYFSRHDWLRLIEFLSLRGI